MLVKLRRTTIDRSTGKVTATKTIKTQEISNEKAGEMFVIAITGKSMEWAAEELYKARLCQAE